LGDETFANSINNGKFSYIAAFPELLWRSVFPRYTYVGTVRFALVLKKITKSILGIMGRDSNNVVMQHRRKRSLMSQTISFGIPIAAEATNARLLSEDMDWKWAP